MNTIGKRFVALVVIFTSMVSFLPVKFLENEQIASAAEVTVNQIKVAADGSNIIPQNNVYTTENVVEESIFTVTVDDKRVEESKIQPGKTEIVKQEVVITAIDGIDVTGTKEEKTMQLQDLGTIILTEGTEKLTNGIGVSLQKLPLGVNKIKYQIKETTRYRTPIVKKADGTESGGELEAPIENMYPSRTESQEITIQNARQFVQQKVESLDFKSYVGGSKSDYNDNNDNKTPFLFTSKAKSDIDMPLSYTFDVPDGTETLNYKMAFAVGVNITSAIILKNGKRDAGSSGSGNIITGSLTALGQRDIITMKIGADPNAKDPLDRVEKTYSIEIKYNYLNSDNDYTLRKPGITKLNYNQASDVKVFIGKSFLQSTDSKDSTVLTYLGEITIDKRAEMISLEPILGRISSNTAFVISNHYNAGEEIANPKQIEGKQYVDFKKGTDNELWVDVYAGRDGNTEGSILARYKLKVKLIDTAPASESVDFSFGDAYLTQPGRKDEKIDFNLDRRTYDLYSGNIVDVSLDSPQTNKKEYIRVWTGNSTNNDEMTEISNSSKENHLSIDVTKVKKMMVQAYYDETIYKKDTNGNVTSEIEKIESYPLGVKYVFYIAKNAEKPDTDESTDSHNASLSGLKFNNGTLKNIDGTSGFLSDKFKYTVTVPKIDTETKITATAQDSKAKSIVAKVVGGSYEYELTSGEQFEIPLNITGTTDIEVIVTAPDGVTKKTYNVTVNNDRRSASSKLKNIFTNVGDFNFDPDNETTKIRVDQNVTNIKITPIPEDSRARVTVDGKTFDGSPISVNLKGSQETDIDIKVTSEDGSNSESYTLEVYRTNSDLPDEDKDDKDEEDIFYDEFDECWVDTSKYEEWGKVEGKEVYFNNKGRQVKNAWITTDGKLYYLSSKGYKESGWRVESNGKTYYLDSSTGELKKGWINQNGSWYYLGLNGVMQKGWLYLNNNWYYFTPNGQLIANQSMYIDGKVYNFAQDGAMY